VRRRTVLKAALATLASLPVRSLPLRAQAVAFAEEQRAMLEAVAAAVLPESLGRAGTDEVAHQFVRWLANYRPDVPMDNGYGQTRQQQTPPSPAERYAAELDALDLSARAQGQAFASLAVAHRRALVETALLNGQVDQLPNRPGSQHIAADLMAFYFRGSEASDRCYRAAIQRYDCRGLEDADQPPPPLDQA